MIRPSRNRHRAGRICRRMQRGGYSVPAINVVIRSLFVTSSHVDIERAFYMLDRERSGYLLVEQFRTLCPPRTLMFASKQGPTSMDASMDTSSHHGHELN